MITITNSKNIITLVVENHRAFSLIGRIASLLQIFAGIAFLYLVLSRMNIVIYRIPTSSLNILSSELTTVNPGIAIFGNSR